MLGLKMGLSVGRYFNHWEQEVVLNSVKKNSFKNAFIGMRQHQSTEARI